MSPQRPHVAPFEFDPTRDVRPVEELPPEQALAEIEAPEAAPLLAEAPERRWRGPLLGLFGVGLIGALVIQAIDYMGGLIATAPLLGWPFALFLMVVLLSAGAYIAGEVRGIWRLSRRAHLRQTAERLAVSDLHDAAPALLAPLADEFAARPGLKAGVAAFEQQRHDAMNDSELLRLFEGKVLAPVDRVAYRLVLESSRDIGLLTALSPLGLLDGMLVMWRTSILLRAIARLYGMAPGPALTLTLLKRSVRNAALAGLADVVTHAALEHAGASLLTLLSARAGSGAGNALLSARLGIEAIRQCRPLPFIAEEPPRLASIRKALFENGKLSR